MLLGKGSSSSVYLLKKQDSKCALKTNPNEREVAFLRKLSHPNIVEMLNTHPQGILLEACVGDLQHVMDSHVNFNYMVDLWLFQLLDALKYLETNSIIHRDIKLANILLNDDYNLKLNDFGLAMTSNERKDLAGTPNYLAPELLKRQQPSYKSDIYAAGVCVYALLSGKLPFEGGTAKQTLTNIVKQKWDTNVIPLTHKHLVSSMMSLSASNRQSASELLASDHFFNLFTPLETMFITPFTKELQDRKFAVLKTGDIIINNPSCAVHTNGSVTLLQPSISLSFFDAHQNCLNFDAKALMDVFTNGKTELTTQLSMESKLGLRLAMDAASKLYKRYHSIMIQGISFTELLPNFKPDAFIIKNSPWRAVLWKNDDFHFRCYDVVVRFVRSSEIIEIYEPCTQDSSFLNVLPTQPNTLQSPFIFQRIAQCSTRGIPNEYKLLINLAQAALKKCLQNRAPSLPIYQSYTKLATDDLDMPNYHPSSEFVNNIGWLIQIPGEKGQMTVELLSLTGERVRIVDDFVFTWHLVQNKEDTLTKNFNGLKQLGPQREGCIAYKKSEIPDFVKWHIQKFRQ